MINPEEAAAGATAHGGTTEDRNTRSGCLGIGAEMVDMLAGWGLSADARSHFRNSRIEFLKGLQSVIEERINRLQTRGEKGTRVTVE